MIVLLHPSINTAHAHKNYTRNSAIYRPNNKNPIFKNHAIEKKTSKFNINLTTASKPTSTRTKHENFPTNPVFSHQTWRTKQQTFKVNFIKIIFFSCQNLTQIAFHFYQIAASTIFTTSSSIAQPRHHAVKMGIEREERREEREHHLVGVGRRRLTASPEDDWREDRGVGRRRYWDGRKRWVFNLFSPHFLKSKSPLLPKVLDKTNYYYRTYNTIDNEILMCQS